MWIVLGKFFVALIILALGAYLWEQGEKSRAKQVKNSETPFYTIDGEDFYIVTKEKKNV